MVEWGSRETLMRLPALFMLPIAWHHRFHRHMFYMSAPLIMPLCTVLSCPMLPFHVLPYTILSYPVPSSPVSWIIVYITKDSHVCHFRIPILSWLVMLMLRMVGGSAAVASLLLLPLNPAVCWLYSSRYLMASICTIRLYYIAQPCSCIFRTAQKLPFHFCVPF